MCHTGSKLRKQHGTVCEGCYAHVGRYRMPNVIDANERRYYEWRDMMPMEWVDVMVDRIQRKRSDVFRWFDTGDLQSHTMYLQIREIAVRIPQKRFWLPTQERQMIQRDLIPNNLTVRVSSVMVNGPRTAGVDNTSSVAECLDDARWAKRVKRNTKTRWYCPSSIQGNKCRECRACWDKTIENVVYRRHT